MSEGTTTPDGNLGHIERELVARGDVVDVKRATGATSRIRLARLAASARTIVVEDSSPLISSLPLRPETRFVQAWSAAGPFERFGYSRTRTPVPPTHPTHHRRYTDAVAGSEFVRQDLAESFWLDLERIHALGTPRTDALFDDERARRAAGDLRSRYGIAADQRIVVYIPASRGSDAPDALWSGDIVDWEALAAGLDERTIMLVRPDRDMTTPPEGLSASRSFVMVGDETGLIDLLLAADVLVTDYFAPAIFDWALLNRPAVFHVPDHQTYEKRKPLFYPLATYFYGARTHSTEELLAAIAKADRGVDADAWAHRRFVDHFLSACDGRSAARVVDRLILPSMTRSTRAVWPPSILPGVPASAAAPARKDLAYAGGPSPIEPTPGLVSVIIPTFNVEDYVEEAVHSVIAQDYRDLEVIVVDDSSTDATLDIVERLASDDPRIRVYRKPRGGVNAARNFGITMARGEYLTFVDGDDILMAGSYSAMVGSLRSSGSDFVVGGYRRLRNGELQLGGSWIVRAHEKDRAGISVASFPRILVNAVQWSKLYRRSFWDDWVGTFAEPGYYQDQIVSARAYSRAQKIDVLGRPTVAWRDRHDGSSMTQQLATVDNLNDRFRTGLEAVDLLRTALGAKISNARLLQLMRFDFGTTIGGLVGTSDEYWAALVVGVRSLFERAWAAGIWRQVSVQHRVLFYLIANDRRAESESFIRRGGRSPFDFETEWRGDDVYFRLPFWREDPAALPDHLFIGSDIQRKQVLAGQEEAAR